MKFKIFFGAIFVCLFLIADILAISHFLLVKNGLDNEAQLFTVQDNLSNGPILRRRAIKECGIIEEELYSYIPQNKVDKFKRKDFKNAHRVLDFTNEKQGDLRAREIFLEYIINEEKENKEAFEYKKEDLVIKNVYAYFVDLNDDGVDEIIGFINSRFYAVNCTIAIHFNILQKQKDDTYKKIDNYSVFGNVFDKSCIFITNKKSNGYRAFITYKMLCKEDASIRCVNFYYKNKYQE